MPSCAEGSKISCQIRCMDPAAVEAAMQQLDPEGTKRVSYKCQLSGKEEEILLIGNQLALKLAETVPEIEDAQDAKILAGLCSAELCECDVATLTGLPEDESMRRLRKLSGDGVLSHRELHRMNYYRLPSGNIRRKIEAAVETSP